MGTTMSLNQSINLAKARKALYDDPTPVEHISRVVYWRTNPNSLRNKVQIYQEIM